MKNLNKFLFLIVVTWVFSACDKVDDLKVYQNGIASVLTASTATVAPLPADSNKTAFTLNWTYPNYGVSDSSSVKYVIEIDSTGKNFTKSYSKVVTGDMGASFTARELNEILLAKGYAFNVPVGMDVRVVSSYLNNNERISSNTVKVMMTPYKIPPKVALPASGKLFIVGGATAGEWSNPVPTPSQELARLSETTFGGVFNLKAGQEFLILPENGDWAHKYAVADNSLPEIASGGTFGYDFAQNFKGPATAGLYKILLDFQSGKFTITPYVGALPNSLFIVGDATAGGWNNPVPVPTQQFTRLNSSVFELTLPLIAGKEYLLLPVNGDWAHKFAVADNSVAGISSGGTFGYDAAQNFPAPATSGTYKIEVNFVTNTFKVTKQ